MHIYFDFNFGEIARIKRSLERGRVVAVGQHRASAEPEFLLEYTTATGCAARGVFTRSELEAVEVAEPDPEGAI